MENLVNKELVFDTLRDKKVFVTGHTGFKGSWMLALLHALQARVKGYALDPVTKQDLFSIVNDDKSLCESVIHDIRDAGKLKQEIISFQPDFIIHMAAQPLVRYSYENPLETFEVNVMGTAYLLEAVRFLDKKCAIIVVTTDKVYQNNETHTPYREEDRLGGHDPYSSSKAMAELVTSSYRDSFFNISSIESHRKAIATARSGNVIGGGDWSKDRIVPDIINSVSNGEDLVLRNPGSVRPWQHVLDPVFGYLLLAAKLYKDHKYSGAWNFGPVPGDELTVAELANKAISILGNRDVNIKTEIPAVHEAGLLKLDISKSIKELSWKPLLDAGKAIEWTIEWYRQEKKTNKNFFYSTK